jgi:hypothetical protein
MERLGDKEKGRSGDAGKRGKDFTVTFFRVSLSPFLRVPASPSREEGWQ